jgi:hypothetical protein
MVQVGQKVHSKLQMKARSPWVNPAWQRSHWARISRLTWISEAVRESGVAGGSVAQPQGP